MEFYMPDDNQGTSQNTPDPNAELDQKIGNIVNSAVTAHIKRFTEKQLPDLLAASLKPITDKLAAPPPPQESAEDEKKKGKQSPELLAMAQKLNDMEKALQAEKDRVAAEQKKGREEKAFQELRSSLEGKVRPEFLDMVAKHLFVVEGRVEVDETGNPLFKTSKAPYAGADPEDIRLPLRAGIEDFLKSDSAKAFLPAPNPGSSSPPLPKRGPSPNPGGTDFSKPATSDADKARRALERERIATEKLNRH